MCTMVVLYFKFINLENNSHRYKNQNLTPSVHRTETPCAITPQKEFVMNLPPDIKKPAVIPPVTGAPLPVQGTSQHKPGDKDGAACNTDKDGKSCSTDKADVKKTAV